MFILGWLSQLWKYVGGFITQNKPEPQQLLDFFQCQNGVWQQIDKTHAKAFPKTGIYYSEAQIWEAFHVLYIQKARDWLTQNDFYSRIAPLLLFCYKTSSFLNLSFKKKRLWGPNWKRREKSAKYSIPSTAPCSHARTHLKIRLKGLVLAKWLWQF